LLQIFSPKTIDNYNVIKESWFIFIKNMYIGGEEKLTKKWNPNSSWDRIV
jgi:hypothetical protein